MRSGRNVLSQLVHLHYKGNFCNVTPPLYIHPKVLNRDSNGSSKVVTTSISDLVQSGNFSSHDSGSSFPTFSASWYSRCSSVVAWSPELDGLKWVRNK